MGKHGTRDADPSFASPIKSLPFFLCPREPVEKEEKLETLGNGGLLHRGGRAIDVQSRPFDLPRTLQALRLEMAAAGTAAPPSDEEPEAVRSASAPNNSSGDRLFYLISIPFLGLVRVFLF